MHTQQFLIKQLVAKYVQMILESHNIEEAVTEPPSPAPIGMENQEE